MKELLRKKSVRISILLIILLVVMGIVGINVRSAQRSKEYDDHITAAEKYLSDLDYEQAIAEYTMAFEIDPKEEVVDALEQTYLAYAQTYVDMGDYDKAVSILEEGYAKIRRESLQSKSAEYQVIQEEIQAKEAEIQEQKRLEEEQRRLEEERRASGMVEFPFRMKDITIRGYDLFGDYFAQLKDLYLAEAEGIEQWHEREEVIGHTSDGGTFETHNSISEYDDTMSLTINVYNDDNYWFYDVNYRSDGPQARLCIYNDASHVFDYAGISVPVTVGKTYEDWCQVMQIDRIKENNLRPEERDGIVGIWEDDVLVCGMLIGESGEYWVFSTEWYQGIYGEYDSGGGIRRGNFIFSKPSVYGAREEWPIRSICADINADGVIERIDYMGWPITE